MATLAIATWKHRGTLYCDDNLTAETTVDATPRRIAALDTAGVAVGLTVDAVNNNIEIAEAGDYLVVASVSFSGTLSKTFEIEIYKNTAGTGFALERKLGTGGDVGNSHVSAIVTCAANDEISLYQSSTDGGTALTVHYSQLNVVRLS